MPDTVAVIMTAFSAYLNSEIDWAGFESVQQGSYEARRGANEGAQYAKKLPLGNVPASTTARWTVVHLFLV